MTHDKTNLLLPNPPWPHKAVAGRLGRQYLAGQGGSSSRQVGEAAAGGQGGSSWQVGEAVAGRGGSGRQVGEAVAGRQVLIAGSDEHHGLAVNSCTAWAGCSGQVRGAVAGPP